MGCGCGGGKKTVLAPSKSAAIVQTPQSVQPRTYDVFGTDGALVASSTNPVLARVEARRTGGTVVLRESTPASQA